MGTSKGLAVAFATENGARAIAAPGKRIGETKFRMLPAAHGKDDKNPSPAVPQGLGHCAVFLENVSFTAGYRKQQLTLPLTS
ncbi:MAG: hypothetical protein HDQ92_09075 [Desulfovibrio sp.]|nr:hypothetical protein [Desulfovibrio sp.]